jgi:CheY-like chemotaxis protein
MLHQPLGTELAGVHFLLVEDNLLNQAVARGILEHMGATLDVVGDGRRPWNGCAWKRCATTSC